MSYDVLIVDDSATTRAILRRALSLVPTPPDDVLEAENGAVALNLLASRHVDLVLADLHMPELDGVELTRRILDNPATRDIPVVVVSAEPDSQRIAALQQQGARGYLKKPFKPEDVRNIIEQLIGGAHHV